MSRFALAGSNTPSLTRSTGAIVIKLLCCIFNIATNNFFGCGIQANKQKSKGEVALEYT